MSFRLHIEFSRVVLAFFLTAAGLWGLEFSDAAEAAERSGRHLTVSREDARSFKLSRLRSPTVRVTFLAAETFRIHVLPDEEDDIKLPEYMVVKSEASYPTVNVKMDTHRNEVTFLSAAAALHIVAEDGFISVDVRTPTRVLIEKWNIYSCCRMARLELRPGERIYGFGDKRAPLDRRGQRVQMLDRDAFASETNKSYKSVPFFLSTAGYGLFFHNFNIATFDLGIFTKHPMEIQALGGDMDFYIFVGYLKQVLAQYTDLTGRPALLPRWAFGYQQGKASYKGREAFEVAAEMRRRKLPVDAIYYDDWIEEATHKDFIDTLWNRYRVRLTLGFGMPLFGRFGTTDDSALLTELAARGFLMVDQNNRPAIGPDQYVDTGDAKSSVGYVDFFSPKAVNYLFAAKWDRALANGTILGMIDFGEMDNIPFLGQRFWPSLGVSVAKTRNLFALVYPLSIVNGVMQRTGDRSTGMVRPGFAGTQRLGWTTTGDSLPTYQNWRAHMRGLLSLTLSGFSNVGQDIGGWDGKGPDMLYARWFAAATFFPFMWSHGQGEHEPYSHGPAVEKAAREFLNLRYRLIPYLYSLHESAHRTGIPILRAFVLEESDDPVASGIDDQFFVGDNLLVAPVFNDEGDRKVYLPKGLWYDFFAEQPPTRGERDIDRKAVTLDRIPLYARAGAVIPLGPAMQYTAEKPLDPLSVNIYSFAKEELGPQARTSEFALYEDDGIGTAYQRGAFEHTYLHLKQTKSSVKFEIRTVSGDGAYRSIPERGFQLRFRGWESPNSILYGGKEIPRIVTANKFGGVASWTIDRSTGDIVISVSRTADRTIDVEFVAEPKRIQ